MLLQRVAVKIAFFVNGFIYASWISRLPRIQELYQASNGMIGLVLLASSIGAVGAMPFTGWMIIRNGSRRMTLYAAIAYCAIVVFIPMMPGIISLMVLFFLMGITTGMLDVAMNAQAVMVEQHYNKPIMTSFHALFSIGMTVGAWSGALFVDLGFSLLNHFAVASALALVAVVWSRPNLVRDKVEQSSSSEEPLFRLPNKDLISIGIIAFCCMVAEGAMGDWSVNYMQNITHADTALAPIGLSAFASAMTIGRIFGDRIRSFLGDRKLIVTGGILSAAGLLAALAFPYPYISIAGFLFVGLGLSSIVPIAYSQAGNAKGLPAGVGLAMVTTVGYSGFLLGPPVIGFLADWQTLRVALYFVFFLLIIMVVLGLRYKANAASPRR